MARTTDLPERVLDAVKDAGLDGLTVSELARRFPHVTPRTLRQHAAALFEGGTVKRRFEYAETPSGPVGSYRYFVAQRG